MIMAGTKNATLHEARLVDIHGTRFYDLSFVHDDAPNQIHAARLGVEDVYTAPQPDDTIVVRYLMNVVVGVTKAVVD